MRLHTLVSNYRLKLDTKEAKFSHKVVNFLKLNNMNVYVRVSILVCLRAIFCKSHPTCDSRVFRISSYFNQLKIKVILEYGRKCSFIRHFVELLGGQETTVVFQERQSVSTSYILKAPSVSQSLRIAFQSSSYFYMRLVRNWTQF